jgi:peptidase M28-like protein
MAVTATAPASPHLDPSWHRELLGELCRFDRETASDGERLAAAWLVERLRAEGVDDIRLEEERGHHTFWWPLGLTSAAGFLAGIRGMRGRSFAAAMLGAAAAWAAADELPPRGRRLRSILRESTATNVVAAVGPAGAPRTVVVLVHHDAAHPGLVFHPAIPDAIERHAPRLFELGDTSPPLMWPAVLGPALSAAGALAGRRGVSRAGAVLSAAFVAGMADIGSRKAVPGANDNGSGVVALLALARALAARPPASMRVLLVSTSEEALCEGMRGFARRHFDELPLGDTFFITIDTIGSPRLLVLRGEGMLGVERYPSEALKLVDGLAAELEIDLIPGVVLRNATDGVYPLAAGYRCATICSADHRILPSNYHWPTDVPENVDYGTLADGIRLAEATIRRLDERWLG